jgi:hypothetical protein
VTTPPVTTPPVTTPPVTTPPVTTPPVTTPPPSAKVHYASISFDKAGTDTLLESLTVNGDAAAREDVAFIANMPRLCPLTTVGDAGAQLTLKVFAATLPPLGDVSAALRYVIRMGNPTIVMRGEVVAFAQHGVSVSVTWDGAKEPNQRELAKVATKAFAKLKLYKP